MHLLMCKKKEAQAVVARGITGSGKLNSLRLLKNRLLLLSTHSKRSWRSHSISLLTILTPEKGRIASAKVLSYNLDKSHLTWLTNDECTFHIFYQFLNASTLMEQDAFN
ncbi:hypothetical protein FA15DRAFT_735362, partial [Coprinopsis marcescibilis]